MIDLECPHCGRVGSVPPEKATSRLVCRKCHMVFHLSPTGRALKGEPPSVSESEARKHKADAFLSAKGASPEREEKSPFEFNFNRRQLLLSGVFLGLIVVTYFTFSGPSTSSLAIQGQRIAKALAAGDDKTLKELASTDSASQVDTWFGKVQPLIEALKDESVGRELLLSQMIVEENPVQGKGTMFVFFAPANGSTRAEKIASAAGSVPDKKSIQQLSTNWVLDTSGKWRLDVVQMLQNPVGVVSR